MSDLIRREDAIKTVIRMCSPICDWELEKKGYTDCVIDEINSLPSADRPTRLTNAEWKDFLSESFGISKSSAREMLHGMMSVKREDNFKKRFNQRRGERREADMLGEGGEEE